MICGNCFQDTLSKNAFCTACGYNSAKNRSAYPQALPPGSVLHGRYMAGKVLKQSSFTITYLAQDHQTNERVAIKEFFPVTIATRTDSTTVAPLSGIHGENFASGKNSFLDDTKTMAEFSDHPHIAGVQACFEENGTAYCVLAYAEGIGLQDYMKSHGGRLSWEEAVKILCPVLDALSAIHEKGILHRDVTPENICIAPDGTVKLLDSGAARYGTGNARRNADIVLNHGFSPREQYSASERQGPYTDLYAVCATLYYAITGVKPPDATDRAEKDSIKLPSALGIKISQDREKALLKGMAVHAQNRYQSAAALRTALLATPKAQHHSLLIPLGAAAALLLIVLSAGLLRQQPGEKEASALPGSPTETSTMTEAQTEATDRNLLALITEPTAESAPEITTAPPETKAPETTPPTVPPATSGAGSDSGDSSGGGQYIPPVTTPPTTPPPETTPPTETEEPDADACYMCDGTGIRDCYCDEGDCSTCGGDGIYTNISGYEERCYDCGGKGACSRCYGDGFYDCEYCDDP